MIRTIVAVLIILLPFAARAQEEQQDLVDRATLTVQEVIGRGNGQQPPLQLLRKARAILVCPRVFRAGFIFGGQGGDCVLVARDGGGSWSYPAFYSMGAGSFGLQAGIQDAEVTLMIMTDRGLRAIIDDQFKIGADASVAFVNMGGGVEGSTTSAVGADIVAFERTRGLFAGIALNGSLIGARSGWNQAYYGRPYATQQIVLQMQARNPAADPLRAVLTRYGSGGPGPASPQPGAAPPRGEELDGPGPVGGAPMPLAPVQQQNLPPPR